MKKGRYLVLTSETNEKGLPIGDPFIEEVETNVALNEEATFRRYLELHAGRSILWDARAHDLGVQPFGPSILRDFLHERIEQIEREIEEWKVSTPAGGEE